jgi:hypothetical protein
MPFILKYSQYDDYELLGLYHTREEAEEARKRYISVELARDIAEHNSSIDSLMDGDEEPWTLEEVEDYKESHKRYIMDKIDHINIFEAEFGDWWRNDD